MQQCTPPISARMLCYRAELFGVDRKEGLATTTAMRQKAGHRELEVALHVVWSLYDALSTCKEFSRWYLKHDTIRPLLQPVD
jgi:hypothetical protein